MNLKGNLTSKGLKGSIGKSRMQGILGTNPAAIPISVDNALSLSSTNPVQNRVITAAITNRLWSDEVKAALLQIVEKVAYIDDHGQTYYEALYDALYPPVGLDSISAVFDAGGATIYNTDTLDDLKQYLTVTAYYTSGDSEVVTTYTLSGSMDAGAQTITVAYGGKTTTFTVTVVEWLVSISAVFTQGSAVINDTDTLDTLRQYLVVTATYSDSTTATVSDYTLSGTLAEGTSTITVSYGGKTDTFNVTVSVGLDSIAYGSKTYRDIFITDNLLSWFGDFESNFVISSTQTTHKINGNIVSGYKVAGGSPANPSVSTSVYNSPTHSLDVSATGSGKYMNCTWVKSYIDFTKNYILAYACNLSNYVSGKVELQGYASSSDVTRLIQSEDTDGWSPVLTVYQPTDGNLTYYNLNFGSMGNTTYGNANFTAYMDDLVFTPLPAGMTQEQALTAYSKYLEIVRRAS